MSDEFEDFFTKVKEALYDAKFAIEQDFDERDTQIVLEKIRRALDLTNKLHKRFGGPGSEANKLLVDTLSKSLADPFENEPPTNVIIKDKK